MRVGLEKRYVDSYKRIAREANKAVKSKFKAPKDEYERALLANNISAEAKKKKLNKYLHELVINTFSVNISKIKTKKNLTASLQKSIHLTREILHKIKAINNYFEESFLKELGIIKRPLILEAIKSKKPESFLEKEKSALPKDYFEKIEHFIYTLIREIIFFDKELLRDYTKKEIKIITNERIEIKDLEKILQTQTELLDILEAKIPPPSKIKLRLFKKEVFNKWVPVLFALLSSYESEYQKEQLIFLKIKKNYGLRKKLESKIKHIVSEKQRMLKIKQERALSMKSFGKIGEDYRQVFHEYISAAQL